MDILYRKKISKVKFRRGLLHPGTETDLQGPVAFDTGPWPSHYNIHNLGI